MPVKLSDDLVREARKEAKSADRSLTAQIEHWAKLGRSVESALSHGDVFALKNAKGNLDKAFPREASREAVLTLLRDIARGHGFAVRRDRAVYQSHAGGAVERIDPDGKRTTGRFVKRTFIEEAPAKRRTRRR